MDSAGRIVVRRPCGSGWGSCPARRLEGTRGRNGRQAAAVAPGPRLIEGRTPARGAADRCRGMPGGRSIARGAHRRGAQPVAPTIFLDIRAVSAGWSGSTSVPRSAPRRFAEARRSPRRPSLPSAPPGTVASSSILFLTRLPPEFPAGRRQDRRPPLQEEILDRMAGSRSSCGPIEPGLIRARGAGRKPPAAASTTQGEVARKRRGPTRCRHRQSATLSPLSAMCLRGSKRRRSFSGGEDRAAPQLSAVSYQLSRKPIARATSWPAPPRQACASRRRSWRAISRHQKSPVTTSQ